jgi:RNA polymerase sigma-70 factor (ECF subfamily)
VTVSSASTSTSRQPPSRSSRFEALFAEHGAAVFAYARRRAAAADADEVVSETFLVAWRRLPDVPAEPLPWLLGVARKCLANLDRGAARQEALSLRLAATAAPFPAAVEPDGSLTPAVAAALGELSASEREVLTLLAWDGLTPAEAAVTLGCTRAAVYLRLHRARRRFAELLATNADPEDAR